MLPSENNIESLNIRSRDIITLISQYLEENNLTKTLSTLSKESGIPYNIVTSKERITSQIKSGEWEKVLLSLQSISLPRSTLFSLYSQMAEELMSVGDFHLAISLLGEWGGGNKGEDQGISERYEELISVALGGVWERGDVEGGRGGVAEKVEGELLQGGAGRLLLLLNKALKMELGDREHIENIENKDREKIETHNPHSFYNIFEGKFMSEREAHIKLPPPPPKYRYASKISLVKSKHQISCSTFTPNGDYLITGSEDGFIEILDANGKEADIEFQKQGKFMVHEQSVQCLGCSTDSKMLCSGDSSGLLKLWNIHEGKCLRKIQGHSCESGGVERCVFIGKKNSRVVSAGYDHYIRVFGLKSGNTMREYKEHTSFITGLVPLPGTDPDPDPERFLTSSADGCIKLWSTKSHTSITTFSTTKQYTKSGIHSISLNPRGGEEVLICDRSHTLQIRKVTGEFVRGFSNDRGSYFVLGVFSEDGEVLYGVGEDKIYIYSVGGQLLDLVGMGAVHKKEVIGLLHHPIQKIMLTYALDSSMVHWVE